MTINGNAVIDLGSDCSLIISPTGEMELSVPDRELGPDYPDVIQLAPLSTDTMAYLAAKLLELLNKQRTEP